MKIHIGTISTRELDKKIRRAYPRQVEKTIRPKKGGGFNRNDKSWRKDDS